VYGPVDEPPVDESVDGCTVIRGNGLQRTHGEDGDQCTPIPTEQPTEVNTVKTANANPPAQATEVNHTNGEVWRPAIEDAPVPRQIFGSGEELSVLSDATAQLMKDGQLDFGKVDARAEHRDGFNEELNPGKVHNRENLGKVNARAVHRD
jgi:hypothetical protein